MYHKLVTVRGISVWGLSLTETPWAETPPGQRHLGRDPPEGTWNQRHRPPEGTWNPHEEREIRDRDPATRKMGSGNKTRSDIIHRPPSPQWINTCENITLPQTSFAGGKNPFFDSMSWQTKGICFKRTEQ